jgi:hypothetical protein
VHALGLWLLSCTLLLAALAVTHAALLVAVASDPSRPRRERLLALVPFLLPWLAYRSGRRAGAIAWVALALGYTLLRMVG